MFRQMAQSSDSFKTSVKYGAIILLVLVTHGAECNMANIAGLS